MPKKKRLAASCLFTFADGRRCRMPRSRSGHPCLCAYHARKEANALAGEQIGQEIALYLSGHYVTANDLSAALGRLFVAVAQGRLKPKTASTLAYLGQTLAQILPLAEHEFINAYSPDSWRRTIRDFFAPPQPGASALKSPLLPAQPQGTELHKA
jgi:hypothetical protein